MRRGLQGAWFMAGLAMLGAIIVGGREAQAGGVSVNLGVGKGGDPFYTYDVYIDLNTATLPEATMSAPISLSVTLTGITGLVSNSVDTTFIAYQYGGGFFPSTFWTWTISSSSGGSITLNETNPFGPIPGPIVPLFELVIITPDTPTQTGLPPGSSVGYTFTAPPATPGGPPQTGAGTVTAFSIPEPSTMVLTLIGAAGLPLLVIRGRRRRARDMAA